MSSITRFGIAFSLFFVSMTWIQADEPTLKPVWAESSILDRNNTAAGSAVLVKSLNDAVELVQERRPPADASAWKKQRVEVDLAVRNSLGLNPLPERTPLRSRIVGTDTFGEIVLERILFESRPNHIVPAHVYRSAKPNSGKRPAILCPIGHYLSAGKAHPDVQSRCIALARMGFVVLVYDAVGQGERLVPENIHHAAGYALLPLGQTVAGWMVWDSMRAVDYLLTRDDVDPKRIGITGNSGGGLNSLFTAALDDRIAAAVVVGFTFEFRNWIQYGGTHCTCTHWPGLFRHAEWFEIAGLIAPRPLMLIQGENDVVFLNSGARRAARSTSTLYERVDAGRQFQYVELPGQPHAYSQPFRQPMYGWFARQFLGAANHNPVPEGDIKTLNPADPRLRCDPDGSVMAKSTTIVGMARAEALARLAQPMSSRETIRHWAEELATPPESHPHNLFVRLVESKEKDKPTAVTFHSEDGIPLSGWLWRPAGKGPHPVVLIANDRGKSAVPKMGLTQPLLDAGYAVFAVDLRGRGETLGHYRPEWDINFRLTANQILSGKPLPGRRAFDLRRTIDFLSQQKDLTTDHLTVVAVGDDVLPLLIASAVDSRLERLVLSRYDRSVVSQMAAATSPKGHDLSNSWNDAQLRGRIRNGEREIDFGSVIPGSLRVTDLPDLLAAGQSRKILICDPRDSGDPDIEVLDRRFRRIVSASQSPTITQLPDRPLTSDIILGWLRAK